MSKIKKRKLKTSKDDGVSVSRDAMKRFIQSSKGIKFLKENGWFRVVEDKESTDLIQAKLLDGKVRTFVYDYSAQAMVCSFQASILSELDEETKANMTQSEKEKIFDPVNNMMHMGCLLYALNTKDRMDNNESITAQDFLGLIPVDDPGTFVDLKMLALRCFDPGNSTIMDVSEARNAESVF